MDDPKNMATKYDGKADPDAAAAAKDEEAAPSEITCIGEAGFNRPNNKSMCAKIPPFQFWRHRVRGINLDVSTNAAALDTARL
jgi:hypothetical protein